jgi:hypothetical protein
MRLQIARPRAGRFFVSAQICVIPPSARGGAERAVGFQRERWKPDCVRSAAAAGAQNGARGLVRAEVIGAVD